MAQANGKSSPMTATEFMDALVRVALVGLMVVLCFRVFSPFLNLMMWALILAVTLYPTHQKVAAKLSDKQGGAATVIVLIGLLLLGVPSVILGSSLAEELTSLHTAYVAGTLDLPPPRESVAAWPVIGEKVYAGWTAADTNLEAFLAANSATIESLITSGLAAAKSTISSIFLFLGALMVAGIMMAYGADGSRAMHSIFSRVAGPTSGPEVHTLATMTTRSVAVGVLGVAFIQAVLLGAGFMLAGVPAAGVLAVIVLLLAIMQLPATIITLPVIIWLWNNGDASSTMNVVWTVYLVLAGLSDNFLKPVLLGRGVDAPMPVILIGALGGMMSGGFIGLFIGAVILAVGYQLFMRWVDNQSATLEAAGEAAEALE